MCNLIYYKLNIYDRKPASNHDSLEDDENKYDVVEIYVFDLSKIQLETTVLINYYSSIRLSVYVYKRNLYQHIIYAEIYYSTHMLVQYRIED